MLYYLGLVGRCLSVNKKKYNGNEIRISVFGISFRIIGRWYGIFKRHEKFKYQCNDIPECKDNWDGSCIKGTHCVKPLGSWTVSNTSDLELVLTGCRCFHQSKWIGPIGLIWVFNDCFISLSMAKLDVISFLKLNVRNFDTHRFG